MQCGVRPKFARAIKKEPTISRRRRRWVAASSESQSLLIRNAQEQTIWFGWTHRLQIYCISDQRGPHRRKMKNGECCTLLKVRATAGTVGEILKSRSILVAVLFQGVCRVHSPKGTCLQIPRPTVQECDGRVLCVITAKVYAFVPVQQFAPSTGLCRYSGWR